MLEEYLNFCLNSFDVLKEMLERYAGDISKVEIEK